MFLCILTYRLALLTFLPTSIQTICSSSLWWSIVVQFYHRVSAAKPAGQWRIFRWRCSMRMFLNDLRCLLGSPSSVTSIYIWTTWPAFTRHVSSLVLMILDFVTSLNVSRQDGNWTTNLTFSSPGSSSQHPPTELIHPRSRIIFSFWRISKLSAAAAGWSHIHSSLSIVVALSFVQIRWIRLKSYSFCSIGHRTSTSYLIAIVIRSRCCWISMYCCAQFHSNVIQHRRGLILSVVRPRL